MRFHVPLTLVPFELSAKVKVYQSDIDRVNDPKHSTQVKGRWDGHPTERAAPWHIRTDIYHHYLYIK